MSTSPAMLARHAHRLRLSLGLTALLLVANAGLAFAEPPIPFSPWGTVVIDGIPAPTTGTTVTAWCGAVQRGQALQILPDQGSTWYSNLDVLGDNPDSGEVDGCTSGELVRFKVNLAWARPTAIWSSVSPRLDLAAPSVPDPPQAPVTAISLSFPDVVVSWPEIALDTQGFPLTVSSYRVYRSLVPGFVPDDASSPAPIAASSSPGFQDDDAGSDPATNYAYRITAVSATGQVSNPSSATMEFALVLVH